METTPFRSTALLLLVVSMFTSPPIAFSVTPAEVAAEIAKIKPVTIEQAFTSRALKLGSLAESVSVQPGHLPLVAFGERNLLVVPISNEGSNHQRLKVQSLVVAAGDNKHVMFYPVVSFVDSNFRVYQTIKPALEFVFDGSTLTNDFEIPVGVEKLLVHTQEDYFQGDFVGHTYASNSPSGGAYGVAGALGGLVGALLLHAVTSSEPKEFTFGEVGEIVINAY